MSGPVLRRIAFLFLIVVCAAGIAAACVTVSDSEGPETVKRLPPEFDRLAEVWELLQQEHIAGQNLDPATVSDGAIRGMLAAIDDPYAAFVDRQQFPLSQQDIQGFFEGIGAEVGIRDGAITILSPIEDSPADMAGLKPGDVILEVDGESIRGLGLLEVVGRIRGEKGTTVRLLVRRMSSGASEELTIERGVIPLRVSGC